MKSSASILSRLWIYQKERFPIFGHGPLILIFTFSAISYSRLSRGADGFISWTDFLIGFYTSFSLFLLLRILDEFKDQEEDALYRSHLPVPRGLVSLSELRILGIIVFLIQCSLIVIFQASMLVMYLAVLAWLFLMSKEFFAPAFMKKRLILYAISHMLIIPFVDLYISGLDWKLEGHHLHFGLILFFIISFFNGLVLEIGRKIKEPEDESVGVKTYSALLGPNKAVALWIFCLCVTAGVAIYAILYASLATWSIIIIISAFVLCAFSAFVFLKNQNTKNSKRLEIVSGVWTLLMYATIGGLPGLLTYLL